MSEKCACVLKAVTLLDRLENLQKKLVSEEPVLSPDQPFKFTKEDFDFLRNTVDTTQKYCDIDLKQISDNVDLAEEYYNKGERETASSELWKGRFGMKTKILECASNPFLMRQARRAAVVKEKKKEE